MAIDASSLEHQRFLELTENFYRQAGCPLDFFESEPGRPLAFDARVGEVKFSVGYDPAAAPACLFVYCVLGQVPPGDEGPVLRRLLELNFTQAREHNGTYCLEGDSQQVVYYQRLVAADTDAAHLQGELVRVARIAGQWCKGGPSADDGPDEEPQDGPPAPQADPWALFA